MDAALATLANEAIETPATTPGAPLEIAAPAPHAQRLDGKIARLMIDLALQDESIDRFSGGLWEEPIPGGSVGAKKPFGASASNGSWRAKRSRV